MQSNKDQQQSFNGTPGFLAPSERNVDPLTNKITKSPYTTQAISSHQTIPQVRQRRKHHRLYIPQEDIKQNARKMPKRRKRQEINDGNPLFVENFETFTIPRIQEDVE